MQTLRVTLGLRSYDIRFEDVAAIGSLVRSATALVVTDSNVEPIAKSVIAALTAKRTLITIPAGEASKSSGQLSRIYDALAEMPADRSTAVIAVGGGVVGDLAGFAAATFNRGLPLIMVPTTLLAMVDSSVGGKTGINHPLGKNLIGSFHQPAGVLIDLNTLGTLPEREFKSGLAEVVKYGASLDAAFFEWLDANVKPILAREPAVLGTMIARCCRLKADIVETDEREESGLRAVLNYGHTFAHAFETLGNYSHWLHGEAVSAGMDCAARLALKLKRINASFVSRQAVLLQQIGLPIQVPKQWPVDSLLAVMRRDKKALAGRLRFVLPSRLGAAELVDSVPEEIVHEVLSES